MNRILYLAAIAALAIAQASAQGISTPGPAGLTTGAIPVASGSATFGNTPLFWDATSSILTVGKENLLIHSEPVLANMFDSSGTVTQASFTENGLTNGIAYPAVAEADSAYLRSAWGEVINTTYTLSVFVVMTDGTAPVPSNSITTGDFSLVLDDTRSTATPTVAVVVGNLYRVSVSFTAAKSAANADYGVIRYVGQSGKAFRVSGYQVNTGTIMLPYTATVATNSPLTGSLRLAGTTANNCMSAAAPAVCGASNTGTAVIAAAATTVVVNTTAVTASSNIILTRDDSLGTRLGVTCNTQSGLTLGPPRVSARTAGASFTVSIEVGPTTNPLCLSYSITN